MIHHIEDVNMCLKKVVQKDLYHVPVAYGVY